MEVKNDRQLRAALGYWDMRQSQFAREIGTTPGFLGRLVRGREPISAPMRVRIEAAFDRVAAGEIVPEPIRKPRRKTRAEQLREEQLASGRPSIIRL